MNKSFKIARKPGQGSNASAVKTSKPVKEKKIQVTQAAKETLIVASVTRPTVGFTTRKTIEVPEDYFYRVKMRALERKMLEKELWAEILQEYFERHPAA